MPALVAVVAPIAVAPVKLPASAIVPPATSSAARLSFPVPP